MMSSYGKLKLVELFYDVISPYSWLAFEVFCRYRNVWNINLKLRPALLGGVYKGAGNRSPDDVPRKFHYMAADLLRLGSYAGVPLRVPAQPVNVLMAKGSLEAMRFVTAVAEKETGGDAQVEKVSRELWMRIWSNSQDITQLSSLAEGFGFPLTVCHVNGEAKIFFGSDRFELMAHCLGEKWMGPQPVHPSVTLSQQPAFMRAAMAH
ncbi:glutathione S-transferase kappa 1-like isoform X2 [Alosa sapidissima]|uniref:glutathione S-transferase kappa 1-like isoform X2 n=1 Tax=Alosa sapidissima TaxID=34773 RepID=UPI001C084D82|nr:glutathione S-transferase kappa 1-like isoform X2 [Alosa sapidissima]